LRCKFHREPPLVQLAREHPRVGDYLSCVGGPELFHLRRTCAVAAIRFQWALSWIRHRKLPIARPNTSFRFERNKPPCGPGNDLCVLALRTSTPSNMGFWNSPPAIRPSTWEAS